MIARLNIELRLWSDPRFQVLMIRVGDRFRALGMAIELWKLAQDYWCPERQLIPDAVWKSFAMPDELIECGLAERRDGGIYARGTEEHFDWYFQRVEAARKGAKITNDKRWGKSSPKRSDGDRQRAHGRQNSVSESESESKERRVVDPTDTTKLWDYYSEKIRDKGIKPIHEGAKTNKICQALVRSHTLEGACALVDLYLNDGDAYIAGKAWALPLLPSQQQRLLAKSPKSISKQPLTFGSD